VRFYHWLPTIERMKMKTINHYFNINMNSERSDEEFLRELACNGDLYQIQNLLTNKPNLNINSQNSMNGW